MIAPPAHRTRRELPQHGRTLVDVAAVEHALRAAVKGEVRFDAGDRALYATDASNYRQPPIGVVIPRDVEDVIAAVRIAHEYHAPILPRGGGTSLAGQCCNTAVVIDFSKHVRDVVEIDPVRRTARVRAGAYLDDVRAAARPHGLTFGPDPATHSHCTIGGMIGNDSCGVRSVMAEFHGNGARTSDNVEAMEVLTCDGVRMRVGPTDDATFERIVRAGGRRAEIYRDLRALVDRHADAIRTGFPNILRRVSGFNLPALLPENGFDVARALVGSEGTCVTILETTLSLLPAPAYRVLLVLGYPSVYEAADAVPLIREHRPIGLEGMDDVLIRYMRTKGLHVDYIDELPAGNGWLIVEFGGDTREQAMAAARAVMTQLEPESDTPTMSLVEDPDEQERIWAVRESGLGATAFVPAEPDTWPGWEDAAVPVDRVGDYLRDFRALLDRYGYQCALYGHFGQGCIHTRIDFEATCSAGTTRRPASHSLRREPDRGGSHAKRESGNHRHYRRDGRRRASDRARVRAGRRAHRSDRARHRCARSDSP